MTGDAGASSGGLSRLARVAVTQPLAEPVAADDAAFFARKGVAKLAFRVLRRRAELRLSGQRALRVERMEPAWRRAVWFHADAPQIGDALMDLAPRSLLAERGIAIDLVAPAHIAALFRGDRWLGRVIAAADAANAIDPHAYDVAIVDGDAWKLVAAKRVLAPSLPWLSLHGEYLAYDFHRGAFGARRFAQWLGVALDDAALARHARQKLATGDESAASGDATGRGVAPAPGVALALGGVRAERSYAHWATVARALAARGVRRFVLVGSDNGRAAAAEVRAALGASSAGSGDGHPVPANVGRIDDVDDVEIVDLVARSDLHGTRGALAEASLVLAADGGLMHLACTTTTPLVALFDAAVDPAWRLPLAGAARALRSSVRDVSAIAPETVAQASLDALSSRKAAGDTGRSQ